MIQSRLNEREAERCKRWRNDALEAKMLAVIDVLWDVGRLGVDQQWCWRVRTEADGWRSWIRKLQWKAKSLLEGSSWDPRKGRLADRVLSGGQGRSYWRLMIGRQAGRKALTLRPSIDYEYVFNLECCKLFDQRANIN